MADPDRRASASVNKGGLLSKQQNSASRGIGKLVLLLSVPVAFALGSLIGYSAGQHKLPGWKHEKALHTEDIQPVSLCQNATETRSCNCTKKSRSNLRNDGWPDMQDEELLWRASALRMRATPEVVPNRKIAFLFMVKGPIPLMNLWERFFHEQDGKYSIFIHASTNYTYSTGELRRPFQGRTIPSKAVTWGGISMVDAERRLLANALLDPFIERFVLVSESCIPLFSFTYIYEFLLSSPFSHVRIKNDKSRAGRGRYSKSFLPHVTIEQWRKGGQFFEVNRDIAAKIVADTLYYTLFRDFCKPFCYSDEHYFPTMLSIMEPRKMSNRTLTWTDWSRGGFHPASFGPDDISPRLFDKMRGPGCPDTANSNHTPSECYLFARKFKGTSLPALLKMASYLGY